METEAVKALAAALVMGMGAIGSGIGEGIIAGKAMESIGRNPGLSDKILTPMLVGMAADESTAIYSLVVALIILFT